MIRRRGMTGKFIHFYPTERRGNLQRLVDIESRSAFQNEVGNVGRHARRSGQDPAPVGGIFIEADGQRLQIMIDVGMEQVEVKFPIVVTANDEEETFKPFDADEEKAVNHVAGGGRQLAKLRLLPNEQGHANVNFLQTRLFLQIGAKEPFVEERIIHGAIRGDSQGGELVGPNRARVFQLSVKVGRVGQTQSLHRKIFEVGQPLESGILDGYVQFETLEGLKVGILDESVDGQLAVKTELIGDGEAFERGDGLPKVKVVEFAQVDHRKKPIPYERYFQTFNGKSGKEIVELDLQARDAVDETSRPVALRIAAIGGLQTETGHVGAGIDQSSETVL